MSKETFAPSLDPRAQPFRQLAAELGTPRGDAEEAAERLLLDQLDSGAKR